MNKVKEATKEQLAELRAMAREYERLSGKQGYLHCYQPEPQGRERFTFGEGETAFGIDMALRYQARLLDRIKSCDHQQIERLTNLPDYCRSCGAMGEGIKSGQ